MTSPRRGEGIFNGERGAKPGKARGPLAYASANKRGDKAESQTLDHAA